MKIWPLQRCGLIFIVLVNIIYLKDKNGRIIFKRRRENDYRKWIIRKVQKFLGCTEQMFVHFVTYKKISYFRAIRRTVFKKY